MTLMNATGTGFEERDVYIATLLLSFSLFAVTAAFTHGKLARLAVAVLCTGLSLLIFLRFAPKFGFLEGHVIVGNGVCVWTLYWLKDRLRGTSFKGSSQAFWYALAATGAAFLLMALPNVLRKSDEDTTMEQAQWIVGLLRDDDTANFYNRLHPKLKEHMTPADFRRTFMHHAGTLRYLSIARADIHQQYDDIQCEYQDYGQRHAVVLRKVNFSGTTRVTDGEIVSLAYFENEPVITDIMIDGSSIFSAQSDIR